MARDQFDQDIDTAKNQIAPGVKANIEASSTLETLATEDQNIKKQNGCNPTALQIYSDIQNKVALNPQFTCAQDGYTAPLDVTMCELYRVYEPSQRAFWAIIDRPAAN